jgi:arginyl-tRNA synthetase
VKKTLTDIILDALASAKEAGLISLVTTPAVIVEAPREEGHGDFATTVALGMAKSEGKPPRKIAEAIRDCIKDTEGVIEGRDCRAWPGFSWSDAAGF